LHCHPQLKGEGKKKNQRKSMTLALKSHALVRSVLQQASPVKLAALALLLISPLSAAANTYTISRVWTDNGLSIFGNAGFSAALTGTVDIPAGNYNLGPNSPVPFTAVNLTLTVTSGNQTTSIVLTKAEDFISGTSSVTISAGVKSLTMLYAGNANGANVAVLQFWDDSNQNCYAIGQDTVIGSQGGLVGGTWVIAPLPAAVTLLGIR
jgi:hypothetical protein